MSPPATCPAPPLLKHLLDGTLADPERAALEVHLETCPHCQEGIESLVADKDSWSGLSRRLGLPDPVPRRVVEGLVRRLGEANAEPSSPTAGLDVDLSGSRPLGDFRLLREVGRGGMGVVYEAEQLSLGRRVALKVLPFAEVLDSRRLQRFKNEAHAAAQLRHPNIVGVHAIGSDRGVHYYAMDFVAGQTLADVIRQQREKPTGDVTGGLQSTQPRAVASTDSPVTGDNVFRRASRWAMQAAEALEHAHQVGIVHRDVKPANLLVDVSGHLWVADFGLAQVREATRLTQTGDFLGTLRYMSPEQTRAGEVGVDHRTDVYSLGATLYELLTLEPAFAGRDPQELLRQIASEEPRPPRCLNPAIPADLETVVLKAMAKNPDERYASARELADDLRRFLNDEAIRARPPSLLTRARRWGRRHRTLAGAAAVCGVLLLVVTVAGLLVSNAVVRGERDRADAARKEAVESLNTARKAVHEMLGRLGGDKLNFIPQMGEVKRDVLREAVKLYDELLLRYPDDPELQKEGATVAAWLGQLLAKQGDKAEGELMTRRAIDALDRLDARGALDLEDRDQLIRAYTHLGWLLTTVPGRRAEGIEAHRQAFLRAEKLAADAPDSALCRNRLASTCIDLGIVWRPTRPRESEALLTRAVSLLTGPGGNKHELGRALLGLGELAVEEERLAEAEKAFREARTIQDELVAANPKMWQLHERLADTEVNLGRVLAATGRTAEAEQLFRHAVKTWETLRDVNQPLPVYLDSLAISRAGLLMVLESGRQTAEAEALAGQLRERRPDNVHAHARMAWALANCPDENLRDPKRAVELAGRAVEMDAERAVHWRALAVARYRAGEPRQALEALATARAVTNRDDGFELFVSALASWHVGDRKQATQSRDRAVKWTQQHRPADGELARLRRETETLMGSP